MLYSYFSSSAWKRGCEQRGSQKGRDEGVEPTNAMVSRGGCLACSIHRLRPLRHDLLQPALRVHAYGSSSIHSSSMNQTGVSDRGLHFVIHSPA